MAYDDFTNEDVGNIIMDRIPTTVNPIPLLSKLKYEPWMAMSGSNKRPRRRRRPINQFRQRNGESYLYYELKQETFDD